jgi:hypothetical protein
LKFSANLAFSVATVSGTLVSNRDLDFDSFVVRAFIAAVLNEFRFQAVFQRAFSDVNHRKPSQLNAGRN